jgi:hypothetical protein
MVSQSGEVLTSPNRETFERYEKQGNLRDAVTYVGIAAAVSGAVGLVFGFGNLPLGPVVGLLRGVILPFVMYFSFTGLVYLIGKQFGGGTGTFDEVAYSFALFGVPISLIGTLFYLVLGVLAGIPLIGVLFVFIALVIWIVLLSVQIYFAYVAIQSSMNMDSSTNTLVTLVLAGIGTLMAMMIASVFLG